MERVWLRPLIIVLTKEQVTAIGDGNHALGVKRLDEIVIEEKARRTDRRARA